MVVHPYAPHLEIDRRRSGGSGLPMVCCYPAVEMSLPGGPASSLTQTSTMDEEQDAFDLAVARVALSDHLPLLAICRGTQIVNVALGGDLVQDMDDTVGNHRNRVHDLDVDEASPLGEIVGRRTAVSCYHHQCIATLGAGLTAAAYSADGVIEAVTLQDHKAGISASSGTPKIRQQLIEQAEVFRHFVAAAALHAREARPSASASAQV